MATVTFTSTNYSAGTCVFTPSDANHSETNLGSITFPFTFNPLAYSLPAEIIEGAFEFTVSGCVFTKQVARSATAATTLATTLATNATVATTQATNATAATTQSSGSGGGSGETLATAATTLGTNATAATTLATAATTLATVPPATIATEATTQIQARYNALGDNTEDDTAKVGSTFAFRIETSGVREGTRGAFTFIEGSPEGGNTERAGGVEGEPFEGEPGKFTIDANGIGSIFIKVRKDSGNVQIQLERQDEDGNETRELVSDRIKLVTDGEPGPVTAATTLATEATNATEAPTSATAATTLATNATEAPTSATAATTLATSATAAPTAETNATNATVPPVATEATEATEATTINEATEATEATTLGTNATIKPTTPTEGTEATAATTLATNATTQATEGTEATQATVTPTEGTNATIKPTTPTEGTEATAAPTSATEATAATTLATAATTKATNATAHTTLSSGDGSGVGGGETNATAATTLATNATLATTQATEGTEATVPRPEETNFEWIKCGENLEGPGMPTIIISGTQWENIYGDLPMINNTLEHNDTRECYSFTGASAEPASADAREYTLDGCSCEGRG